MMKWIFAAALASAAAGASAAQAQAHAAKRHHPHAAAHPGTVMQDGQQYKVCTATVQDGCIQPREAGLGYGNRPTDVYRPDKADQHP